MKAASVSVQCVKAERVASKRNRIRTTDIVSSCSPYRPRNFTLCAWHRVICFFTRDLVGRPQGVFGGSGAAYEPMRSFTAAGYGKDRVEATEIEANGSRCRQTTFSVTLQ